MNWEMKRTLILTLAVVAVLCAAATDRFYIDDFSINPNEMRTVYILLDNEVAYTAFQTDIYMPSGLMIGGQDGDYIFGLTERKSRDHIIVSQLQADGAIRVMSYSNRINPYIGDSGGLVVFNVIADANFTGSGTIKLENTLFTTIAGAEIAFSEEDCVVTTGSASLKGDVNGDGIVNISDVTTLIDYLLSDNSPGIQLENADLNIDGNVNISDVTVLIDNLLTVN